MNLAPSDTATIFDSRLRTALRESVRAERPSPHVREAVLRIVTDTLYPPDTSDQKRAPGAPRSNANVLIFEVQRQATMKYL
jgi:hypothetical protein